ncbi:MAG: arginine--tRNA ligase [Defluviitaleaceae bacterium]|nr:arginine--tRNA ligase [Defluviitaleaceae bacterium]
MNIEAQIKKLLPQSDISLEVPQSPDHGEYSSNIAMKLAKTYKKNPRELAQELINQMDFSGTYINKVEIAGAGYINFFASDEWFVDMPSHVVQMGDAWGSNNTLEGERICLEYVSANPTGPMHMGNARGGALGDSLARAMSACGAQVTKEFYLNDAGNQIAKLEMSLDARFRQLKGEDLDFNEDWYQGQDVIDHAQAWADKGNSTSEGLLSYALEQNISNMKQILQSYNIDYDVWFHESVLYESDAVNKAIQMLRDNNQIYEKDGAVWLRTEGDMKDEVLIRENGIPTYFAADIAYHYNKFVERGFTKAIDVWGADHGGHIARMKAAMQCLGIDPANLEIITIQLVRLMRDGQIARMSKRKGDTISLGDLIEEIGVDSARFFFNMRNSGSAFDFDLDLAVKQSSDNPVFYVQYAHARICSILEQSNVSYEELLQLAQDKSNKPSYKYDTPQERALIRRIALYPRELVNASHMYEPSSLTTYVRNVASDFHAFYTACKVNNAGDESIKNARLILALAARQTIKNVLEILGVAAPEKMKKLTDEQL